MSVTIYDVAKRAGVSITTVSNVIHGKENIPETTSERVRAVMRELGFIPNKLAQRLVTKKTETVALLIPTMENPFFTELYNGIERYIEEHRPGYKLMIGNIGYSVRKEAELIAAFRREFFDGYIIVSNDPSGPEVRLLEKQGIPLVFAANDPAEIAGRPLVTYNNFDMAHAATRFLVDMGHRRFGYIAGTFKKSSRSQSRHRGFRECLRECGIPFDERFFVDGGEYTSRRGYECFRELAGRCAIPRSAGPRSTVPRGEGIVNPGIGDLPTALFCANDVLAIGAIRAVRESGLRIPEDISVVGFDDIPASEYLDPPLTTVSVRPAEIGWEAAALLFRIIDGDSGSGVTKVIEGRLVVRKSCAPPLGGQ